MRTIEKTIFTFDELTDEAKENAREAYRGWDDFDVGCIYEDAATVADILGIDLRQRPVKLMDGQTRYDPAIYYSGFYSQGDGACFEGEYRYKPGAAKVIREYAPQDEELHRIADRLQAAQRWNFYQLRAACSHRGHYYHSGCMSVDVYRYDEKSHDAEDDITQLLRDFADWIYARLEAEYEYKNSDESIRANEYEFYENGGISMNAVILILSDARGVYIPRDFVTDEYNEIAQDHCAAWGIKPDDAEILAAGPEHEFYWETWDDVLGYAEYTDENGDKYRLYQDGDLWGICHARMSMEERQNFGFDECEITGMRGNCANEYEFYENGEIA